MMAATAVGMILNDFWKIWLKTLDARNDCQKVAHSLMECTQLFVVNLAPLTHPVKKQESFPYERRKLNTWFMVNSDIRNGPVNLINVDKDGDKNKCYAQDHSKFPRTPVEDDKYDIYYHGTTARHAKVILEDGIHLSSGGQELDFSDGGGFYLTNKFGDVWPNVRWSKRKPPCSTVLVYKVDKSKLRGIFRALDLQLSEEKWRDVVWTFRNSRADDAFIEGLNADFIEGPICSGGGNYRKRESCIPVPDSYQLCVRNKDCAEFFDESLLSVVFFESNLCRE